MKKTSVVESGITSVPSACAELPEARIATRILVHVCCGPCSIMPLKSALAHSAEVCGFFHNPNIHPYAEFKKRLDAVKTLARLISVKMIYDEAYSPRCFIKGVKMRSPDKYPQQGKRCSYCYASRLEATAKAAADNGFDAFSSSLLYSRYQNHEEIRLTGSALARKYKVRFYYEDFRLGWQAGITESKTLGLYRQRYCGCVYSKMESKAGSKPGK